MKIIEAEKMGVMAFKNGLQRPACLNQEFITKSINTGNFVNLCKAYYHGYSIALLASNAPLDTMPSLDEYERIMKS